MLTRLRVRNFRLFESLDIELGSPTVFFGPNNSGKTAAMQALVLWKLGLNRWHENYGGQSPPPRSSGIPINRTDLFTLPHPPTAHFWNRLRTRKGRSERGKISTTNNRIDLIVDGVSNGRAWECGLEFDYANEDQISCRPLRLSDAPEPERMAVPVEAVGSRIANLPPMSGLVDPEPLLSQGSINVRVGKGRTAEVMRNVCRLVFENDRKAWDTLVHQIARCFSVELEPPVLNPQRGEITLAHVVEGVQLDVSAAGSGLHQTLLVLAYMHYNKGAVLMIDEPGAHLEALRQREIYDLLVDTARQTGSQLIAASHSEVLLNEAAGKDLVIVFGENPQPLRTAKSRVLKSIRSVGYDQYVSALRSGWVLYLEDSTDRAILKAFATRLGLEKVERALDRPFVKYVGNSPSRANEHFLGLRHALPDLRGIAVYDRLDTVQETSGPLEHLTWRRRGIESYLCTRRTLEAFALGFDSPNEEGTIFWEDEKRRRAEAMRECIDDLCQALETMGQGSPWDEGFKVSDLFLTPLFRNFFRQLELPNLMAKKSFHELAQFVPEDEIDPEIIEKLDTIARVAGAD